MNVLRSLTFEHENLNVSKLLRIRRAKYFKTTFGILECLFYLTAIGFAQFHVILTRLLLEK